MAILSAMQLFEEIEIQNAVICSDSYSPKVTINIYLSVYLYI